MPEGIAPLLSMAFGLGLLHALDADHIVAVTALSCTDSGRKGSLGFCIRWAFGHGLTLLAIGTAVLLLGMAIPAELSGWAERAVGVVLILIGAWVWWDLWRNRTHLHYHEHDGMRPHAHWHRHDSDTNHRRDGHDHQHGAVLVGALHGTAGSAPLLALLPVAVQDEPWLGIAYLVLFGLGVLLSMVICGGALGWLLARLGGGNVSVAARGLVGLGSAGAGLFWLTV